MGIIDVIGGMINFNKAAQNSTKEKTVVSDFKRTHLDPVEKLLIGAVLFTTSMSIGSSILFGNSKKMNRFNDGHDNYRSRDGYDNYNRNFRRGNAR